VSWKIDPPTMGTISASGIFIAGPEWGQATITVTAGALSAVAPVVVKDANGRDPSAFAAFDRKVIAYLNAGKIPGAALAVIKNGRLVYTRGYGFGDLGAARPARADSLFRLASVSKQLTAISIMRLVQDGRLSLDAKVFDLLGIQPFLGVTGATTMDARIRSITVRNLLEHSGGWDRDKSGDPIGRLAQISAAMGVPSPPTMQQFVAYMFGQPLDFDPGTAYAYSNFGYNVLGAVIEKVTGGPYESYVRSVIANVGVTRTRIGDARSSSVADGEVTYYPANTTQYRSLYSQDSGRLVSLAYGSGYATDRSIQASSGWIASPVDLARILAAVKTRDARLLSAASINEMLARPSLPLWPTGYYWYAKGWGVGAYGTARTIDHGGFMSGTMTQIVGRWDDVGWVILFNKDVSDLDATLFSDMNVAANAVTAWPSWDLFPEHP